MSAAASLERARRELASVPDQLRRLDALALAPLSPRPTIVTGIGGSEGPARLFASVSSARFVPLSSFAVGQPRAERCVVFSQGLSSNARLALRRRDFEELVVVTAVDPERHDDEARRAFARDLVDAGARLVVHGPEVERGMLVRLVGPTVASSVALCLARPGFEPSRAAAAYERAGHDAAAIDAPLVLLASGELTDALFSLRWKWLETFGRDPHVLDVLASAHGPLQALYEGPATWLAFADDGARALVDRLAAVLPPRHHLRPVAVPRDADLAFFAATGALDACLRATLEAAPRDLFRWPAQGADGPLYDLGG